MPMIDVNGTSLYYEDTGPGSTGETIVWSHGLLWGTELFEPQIAALRGRYRCVAWDHRGQGRSAPDHRHTIDMELVWQDALCLIERLQLGAVHFVGLSMGGFTGLRMAARRPALVKKLVIIESSAQPEPIENVGRYRLLSAVNRVIGSGVTKKRVAQIMLGKTILADPRRTADVERFAALMARRRDIWRAVNGVIDRAGVECELPQIAAPTLVIVGDEDVATTPQKGQALADGIAGARFVVIPRAGHSSTVEEPAAVTAAIEAFLT
ncbi:MAG: alpha/beta fold hydrolase [Deltaproteobacteria bacterium]|nr:alpha/beta fold hydrolase [Deltaproteobacteria bacterium]